MSYILEQAAQASSSSAAAGGVPQPITLAPELAATLRRSCRPDDQWVLVECGFWDQHVKGWTGPASALFQVWPLIDKVCDYAVWELGPDLLPTGNIIPSGSG